MTQIPNLHYMLRSCSNHQKLTMLRDLEKLPPDEQQAYAAVIKELRFILRLDDAPAAESRPA